MSHDQHIERPDSGQGKTSLPVGEMIPRKGPLARGHRPRTARRDIASSEGFISLDVVIKAIRNSWKVAVPVGLFMALLSVTVVWLGFTPQYEASAWLQIDEQTPYIAYDLAGKTRQYVETQTEMFRSPLVLGAVVTRPEVAALPELAGSTEPIRWLAERVQAESVGRSELVRVSCTSDCAASAALLANAVVDAYFEVLAQKNRIESQRVIELLGQERERRERILKERQDRVRELSRQVVATGTLPAASGVEFGLGIPLGALQDRLSAAEVDREVMEAEIRAIEESIEHPGSELPENIVRMAINETPEVQRLLAHIASKRDLLQQTEATARHGKDDPSYLVLAAEVARYEQLLDGARQRVREGVVTDMESNAVSYRQGELSQRRSLLDRQRSMVNALQERYQEQLKTLGSSGDQSLNLEFARAEMAREERVYELIAERALALQTEVNAPSRVTLIKHAVPPTNPVTRMPAKGLAIALLGSLLIPFGIAVLRERNFQRIGDVKELEHHSDLAVVAEIAKLPLKMEMGEKCTERGNARQRSLYEESIDSLRTCLVLADDCKEIQVLTVASAVPREGKTNVASQLALSLARSTGSQVLLIDADMRSPDLHRMFHIPEAPGLVDVLQGRCPMKDAIYTGWSDQIHVLPAGRLTTNPHRLVSNGEFQAVLKQARESYRYVILDAPPILSASESLVFSKEADGTLVCALRNVSRGAQVRLASSRLMDAGARPLGAVLSGVPFSEYAYRYGEYTAAHSDG